MEVVMKDEALATELAIFAGRYKVPLGKAPLLPTIFETAAAKAGGKWTAAALAVEATYRNPELAEYLLKALDEIAETDIAKHYLLGFAEEVA
jgi:ribosomal protein S18 acetylase RimI-like enzyme